MLDRLGIDAYSQDFIADLQIPHLKNLYDRTNMQLKKSEDAI